MQPSPQKVRKTAGGKVSLAAPKSSRKNRAVELEAAAQSVREELQKFAVELSCKEVYLASPFARVEAVRNGLAAELFTKTVKEMHVDNETLYAMLHLSRATISRKLQTKGTLPSETSQRLLGLRKLIGQVEVMVEQSGVPKGFSAAKWVAGWLDEPSAALAGKKPGEFMDTAEGQELVSKLVARMQSGAYS